MQNVVKCKKGKDQYESLVSKDIIMNVFYCENSFDGAEAAEALDPAGDHIRLMPVPCSGRIDYQYLLKAFELGADAVVVAACEPAHCYTIEGGCRLAKRIEYTRKLMAEAGLEPERLAFVQPDTGSGTSLTDIIKDALRDFRRMIPEAHRKSAA